MWWKLRKLTSRLCAQCTIFHFYDKIMMEVIWGDNSFRQHCIPSICIIHIGMFSKPMLYLPIISSLLIKIFTSAKQARILLTIFSVYSIHLTSWKKQTIMLINYHWCFQQGCFKFSTHDTLPNFCGIWHFRKQH